MWSWILILILLFAVGRLAGPGVQQPLRAQNHPPNPIPADYPPGEFGSGFKTQFVVALSATVVLASIFSNTPHLIASVGTFLTLLIALRLVTRSEANKSWNGRSAVSYLVVFVICALVANLVFRSMALGWLYCLGAASLGVIFLQNQRDSNAFAPIPQPQRTSVLPQNRQKRIYLGFEPNPPKLPAHSAPSSQATCLVCNCPLIHDRVSCKSCQTPHHQDCWHYNQRCAVFGCGQENYTIDRSTRATA